MRSNYVHNCTVGVHGFPMQQSHCIGLNLSDQGLHLTCLMMCFPWTWEHLYAPCGCPVFQQSRPEASLWVQANFIRKSITLDPRLLHGLQGLFCCCISTFIYVPAEKLSCHSKVRCSIHDQHKVYNFIPNPELLNSALSSIITFQGTSVCCKETAGDESGSRVSRQSGHFMLRAIVTTS